MGAGLRTGRTLGYRAAARLGCLSSLCACHKTKGQAAIVARPQPKPRKPISINVKGACWAFQVMSTAYAPCAFLALGVAITYFERNGFAVAMTVASDAHGLPQSVKGDMMSLFFSTYLSTHLVGGALARQVGGLLMLRRMTAVWALCALVSPFHPSALPALRLCRLGIGLSQGFVFPALHTLLSEMTTARTRGRVVSLVVSSIYLGSAFSMVTSPTIVALYGSAAQSRAAGALALGWLALSACVRWPGHDASRVLRLRTSRGGACERDGRCSWASDVPWLRMASSPAVLVMMASSFTFHLVVFFLQSWTPTFVLVVLKEALRGPGASQLAQAAPWLLMYAVAVVAGSCSDAAAARLGIRAARKLVCAAGLLSCAPCLILVPHARSAPELYALSALVLMAAGFSRGGWSINHIDIGPAYAGVLQGYAGTAGNLAGVVATRLPGRLLSADATDRAVWHLMFRMLAALCVLTAVCFLAFAEGEVLFHEGHCQAAGSGAPARGASDAPSEGEGDDLEGSAERGGAARKGSTSSYCAAFRTSSESTASRCQRRSGGTVHSESAGRSDDGAGPDGASQEAEPLSEPEGEHVELLAARR